MKYLIIGAGVGGLFSARALVQAGVPATDIIILEKESMVGGKCRTYRDPNHPNLIAEYGAMLVAHNYGIVLDAVLEKKITLKKPIPTKCHSLSFPRAFATLRLSKKIKETLLFLKEWGCYNKQVYQYRRIKALQGTLPPQFEQPFTDFAAHHGFTRLNNLLRLIVTGFGYGALEACPTFAVMEYLGYTTLAGLLPVLWQQGPFYTLAGGFQRLLEAMATDFTIITEANITRIERNHGVRVYYERQGKKEELHGDYIILALSPKQWPSLGLTSYAPIEKRCLEHLTHHRYPVLICKLKGYPMQQEFFEEHLYHDKFTQLALITTNDNRPQPEDGRLCTAYVNLKPNDTSYHLTQDSPDGERLLNTLASLPGVTNIEFLDTKTWDDYMSFLPWQLRTELISQQFSEPYCTAYVHAGLSFEDVACIATQATQTIFQHMSAHKKRCSLWQTIKRWRLLLTAKSPYAG